MGARADVLRRQIEETLANRIPAALSPLAVQAPRLHPVGNPALDALLGGGLPLGSVCEVTGPEGSGRTSLALSLLAQASAEAACAYIDVSDTLSPHAAAAAGACLNNLLWVRFTASSTLPSSSSSSSSRLESPCPAPAGTRQEPGKPCESPQKHAVGWSHPREETRGLGPALQGMLLAKQEHRQHKREGTPGHPNQPLGLGKASQEQIEWERFNLREVDESDPLRLSNRRAAEAARQRAASASFTGGTAGNMGGSWDNLSQASPWDRLGKALRAADQILQSGGFRVVVLDLASVSVDQALRIPSATWFRFRRAAQESDAVVLLLTKQPCARSSAACVLECSPGAAPRVQGVLARTTNTVEIARQRTGPLLGKKAPGRAASWSPAPVWMRAAGQ